MTRAPEEIGTTGAGVLDEAKTFMARFFSMGAGSCVNSHEPHETLKAVWPAYQECIARGWVNVEPFNRFGSVHITATDEGREVARERFKEITLEMFAAPASAEDAR